MTEANANSVQMGVERIYLKDASFESPGSPDIFTEQVRPEMQVDINTRVSGLSEDRHEVVLSLTITARKSESAALYVVEVQQAGVFKVSGPEDTLRPLLGIACPNLLFPYAREAVDNLVVKGGFGPVNLAPVNFEMIYRQAIEASKDGQDSTQH